MGNKWNLIWIIPEIAGSLALGVSAALHINIITSPVFGFMEWVFQIGLVMCVLLLSFKLLGFGCEKLNEVKI